MAAQQRPEIVRVSDPRLVNPAEVSVAVNPVDRTNIVAVSLTPLGNVSYASHDGGTTWTTLATANPDGRRQADDAVTFDAQGRVYHSYISFVGLQEQTPQRLASGIFVAVSDDGGGTWHAPVPVVDEPQSITPFHDKPYLVTDRSPASDQRGNVYVTWTRFDAYRPVSGECESNILLARSVDQGQSFETPVVVSDSPGDCLDSDGTVQGAVPAVGPSGTVYVVWSGPGWLLFDQSDDGGKTFGADRVIGANPGGWDLPIAGLPRHNGMPVTRVDLSDGPFRGSIYVNWIDERNGDTDVFLTHSRDGGQTWSEPVRVNDDDPLNHRPQFFTWMAVDPTDGSVNIVFYDRRNTTGLRSQLTLARSVDGGRTFVNHPLGLAPFECAPYLFFGDYIGIDAFDGKVVAAFGHCPIPSQLVISAALFSFASGQQTRAGVLDDASLFDPSRSLSFDFEGMPIGAEATDLLDAWGLRFSAMEDVRPATRLDTVDTPEPHSDVSIAIHADGSEPGRLLILESKRPLKKVGCSLWTSDGARPTVQSFGPQGESLGKSQLPEPGPANEAFFGLEAFDTDTIARLVVDYGDSGFQRLDDLIVEFADVPTFERFIGRVADGPVGSVRFRTVVLIDNRSKSPTEVHIDLFDEAGDPLRATLLDEKGPTSDFAVDGHGVKRLLLAASPPESTGGLSSTVAGYARVRSSKPVGALAIYQLVDSEGGLLSEAGINGAAAAALVTAAVQRRPTDNVDSGIAIVNGSNETAIVHLTLIESSSSETAGRELLLPGKGQYAQFISELFDLPAQEVLDGSIRISSDRPIAVVVLRTRAGRVSCSLPVGTTSPR